MTTVISNNRPSSSTNQHLVLEPSMLPFPTAPSLPDRRTRLKRTNMAPAILESVKSENSLGMHKSNIVSRVDGEGRDMFGELALQLSALSNEISSDNSSSKDTNSSSDGNSRINESDNNSRDNNNSGDNNSRVNKSDHNNSRDNNSRVIKSDNNNSRDNNNSGDNNSRVNKSDSNNSRDNNSGDNSSDNKNRRDNYSSDNSTSSSVTNSARDNSNYSNKGPRGHRNIVTSRRRADKSSASALTSQSATSFNIEKSSFTMNTQEYEDKLFLPTINSTQTADPPPLPPGVFLTSLAFEDYPTHREPGLTFSRLGKDTASHAPSGLQNNMSSSRDQLSDLVLSGDSIQSSRALTNRSTFGLQRVYMEGLEYMRTHVSNVEQEVDVINRQFHKVVEDDWLSYVKECNQHLLQANASLLKTGVPLRVIDSETSLVALINCLRAESLQDNDLVEFLTRFWGELKSSTEHLQVLVDKFNSTVLQRFSNNYTSSHIVDLQVPFCHKYALDIEEFLKDLDSQLANARLLLKNNGNAEYKNLTGESWLAERLMISCDLKAFPILRFVSQICGKITAMCETARQWLARDEEFMHEVNAFIRETRAVTRKREQILLTEKMKQKRVEKNVKIAHCILHKNRDKLGQIEAELQELEQKLNKSKEEHQARLAVIHHKESMVDFFKVTLQQTRKNCRLQTKRRKLLKQVKEIEDYLKVMEVDLELVQDQILAKFHQRILLTEKINTSEKSYGVLKSDLDRFSDSLEELEAEVGGLSGQLLQLEIVHTIRTSPEILDNLTDRPSSVRLSQSLKERIRERQRKSVAFN